MPTDCMNAYIVVGPTKLQPRFFSAFDSATEAGDWVMVRKVAASKRSGRSAGFGSNDQMKAASDPASETSSTARRALLIVDSILPRCRTIPGSRTEEHTSELQSTM